MSPRARKPKESNSIAAPSLYVRPLPSSEMSGWQESPPDTWRVSTSRTRLGAPAGGFDSDATVMELGVSLPVSPAEIARTYAARLAEHCPEAAVYYEDRQAGADTIRVAVVAPAGDPERERTMRDLSRISEAEEAGLVLDVSVYLEDRSPPDMTGFTRVR